MSFKRVRDINGNIQSEIPGNILDQFRSYVAHHVLLATIRTDDSKLLLSKANELTQDIKSKRALEKIDAGNGKIAYVIANSFCESRYIIDNVQYESNLTTLNSTIGFVNTGAISIKEPYTANFLQDLNRIANYLDTQATSMIYVLKTYIVGVRSDGTQGIIEINPVLFWLNNLIASFNDTGGQYDMQFVSQSNITDLVDYGKIQFPEATVSKTGTFESAISCLTQSINTSCSKQWEELKKQGQNPRKTEYIITYPNSWKSFILDTPNSNNQKERDTRDTKSKAKPEGEQIVVHGPNTKIKDMISNIVVMTPKIKEFSNSENKETVPYVVSINTHTIMDSDTVYFYYHIYPYPTYRNMSESRMGARPENIIEFDYLFSGRNEDILSFDMKIEDAIILLGTAGKNQADATANLVEKKNANAADKVDQKTNNTESLISGIFDDSITDSIVPKRDNTLLKQPSLPGSTTRYGTLSIASENIEIDNVYKANFAALSKSSVEIALQIRGNPIFINMKHDNAVQETEKKADYDAKIQKRYEIINNLLKPNSSSANISDSDFDIVKNAIPLNFKINVYSPKNADFKTPGNTLEPFYYSGHYAIWSIGTSFNGGDFTQTLNGKRMGLIADSKKLLGTL